MTLRRETEGVWILENEAVRVRFARGSHGYAETYWSLGDRWRLVLEAGSKKRADLMLTADGRTAAIRLTSISLAETTGTRVAVRLEGSSGVHRVTKTVTMEQGDPFVRVEIYDAVEGLSEVSALLSTLSVRSRRETQGPAGPHLDPATPTRSGRRDRRPHLPVACGDHPAGDGRGGVGPGGRTDRPVAEHPDLR